LLKSKDIKEKIWWYCK